MWHICKFGDKGEKLAHSEQYRFFTHTGFISVPIGMPSVVEVIVYTGEDLKKNSSAGS